MLNLGGSSGSHRQRLGVYVTASSTRQNVAKRVGAVVDLLSSLLACDAREVWSAEVDSGGDVWWSCSGLLSAAESVGGSSVFIVCWFQKTKSMSDQYVTQKDAGWNYKICHMLLIHYKMADNPFDLSSSRPSLSRLLSVRTSEVQKPASQSRMLISR
jgi:hypothetical protein